MNMYNNKKRQGLDRFKNEVIDIFILFCYFSSSFLKKVKQYDGFDKRLRSLNYFVYIAKPN